MKVRAGLPLTMFVEAEEGVACWPLYRRAYQRLRRMILDGALAPGQRLPSTRTLAADLGLSRNTLEAAFAQLQAEGYIRRRVGSGSHVTDALPDRSARAARGRPPRQPAARAGAGTPPGALEPRARTTRGPAALSERGRSSAESPPSPGADADATFGVCRPGLDVFPVRLWNRTLLRRARAAGPGLLDESPPEGLGELRRAVAEYVVSARGVRCEPGQVLIVSSTQQALDLVARVLLDPGNSAWVEEPCYTGARLALAAAGARLVPVPVDDQGLSVKAGQEVAPDVRLVYVTPSHQFPLGVTMALQRRLELLAWAERQDAWIVEDDYDSEFRYAGRPLAALQGLDNGGRVLYVGTFNKVMFPSLRLAYLVVPADLVEPFSAARRWMDGYSPGLAQAAMADFIAGGHFGAHIREMREVYRRRRDTLLEAVATYCGDRVRLGPAECGMHVVGWLSAGTDVALLGRRAAAQRLYLRDLAVYYQAVPPGPGLVLNFASSPPAAIARGIRLLAQLL